MQRTFIRFDFDMFSISIGLFWLNRRNFAGVLIVWDRLFGTFEEEQRGRPCIYGLDAQVQRAQQGRCSAHSRGCREFSQEPV